VLAERTRPGSPCAASFPPWRSRTPRGQPARTNLPLSTRGCCPARIGARRLQMARFMTVGLIGLGFSCVVAAPASAAPIPLTPIVVGDGDSHAFVQIDFGDGATYVFDVAFEGDVDGFGLLDQIKTDVDGF